MELLINVNETKAKVFAPYLGVAWVHYNKPMMEGARAGILSGHDLQRIEDGKEPYARISLKSLSEITKEDADIVASIFFKDTKLSFEIMHKYKDGKVVLCNGITKHKKPHPLGENITFETDGQIWHDEGFDYDNVTVDAPFRVFQFLQSKGYDMPNYHLRNKTLFESGLAIYK